MDQPLIHIGYHKTGTTWLQKRVFVPEFGFGQHSPRQEVIAGLVAVNPFSFDAEAAKRAFAPFMESAKASGHVPVLSHERLSGQPLYNGYDARDIADRIRTVFGPAKILVVIRRQNDFMLSLYKHHVKHGGTDTVEKLWRPRGHRELRRPWPGLEMYEYHHLIAYYQALFGAENVLVLPYERLRENAVDFVGEICKFVGLSSPTDVPSTVDNPSLPPGMVNLVRYSNALLRVFGLTTSVGGPLVDERIERPRLRVMRRIGALVGRALPRSGEERMKEAVDRIASGRFTHSNAITAKLTGLDLTSFGYE